MSHTTSVNHSFNSVSELNRSSALSVSGVNLVIILIPIKIVSVRLKLIPNAIFLQFLFWNWDEKTWTHTEF